MSLTTLDFGIVDRAIIRALRGHSEGIRYNDLHRGSKKEDGKNINIKTFDKHLKWLVSEEVVKRIEKGRAEVYYKLRSTERDERIRKFREREFENFITKPISSLFDRRKELTEEQLVEELWGIIDAGILRFIGGEFVIAALAASQNDSGLFSLSVNNAMEHFREAAIVVSKAVWNEKTEEFFTRAMLYGY